jgi:hypothetical protein
MVAGVNALEHTAGSKWARLATEAMLDARGRRCVDAARVTKLNVGVMDADC